VRHEAHNTLGTVHASLGRLPQATDHHRNALRLAGDLNAQHQETEALLGLAAVCAAQHQHAAAAEHARQALALTDRAGYRLLQAQALTTLATIELAGGQHDQAADHARQALAIHRQTGHLLGEGRTLVVLGHTRRGSTDATTLWRQALSIFTAAGAEPDAARVRDLLAQ
jgi:tetratricopeptide (TPR) repeat protein